MNPYIHRSMIPEPEAFFGRKAELRRIFDLLERPSCVNIVGNRRIGKSSILGHVCRRSVYHTMLHEPDSYLFVFIDLQELAELDQSRFFATIMSRASEASGGKIPPPSSQEVDVRAFRHFIRQYCQPAGHYKLICCFDEFEKMSRNKNFDVPFFQTLRALAQQYRLGYIISSRTGIEKLCHQGDIQGSQFWNIFALEQLRLMTPEEAGELITSPFQKSGFPLSVKEIELINQLAGTYPFFIQIACFHLFSTRQTKKNLAVIDLEAIKYRFQNEVGFHFDFMFEQLSDEARAYFFGLIENKQQNFNSSPARELVNQSLIAIAENQATIFSEAFREFVIAKRQAERPLPQPDHIPDVKKTPKENMIPGPSLSICLWGERSAVVELNAPRRLFTVTETSVQFDTRSVEDWRRRAEQIYQSGARWRERLRREGSQLFGEIIVKNPKINGAFSAGLAQADPNNRPLQMIFRTPRELLALPLELLFEEEFASGEEGPLALLHPVSRYITDAYFDRPALMLPFANSKALRVLLLAGADDGLVPKLNLDAELEPLKNLLQGNAAVERIDLIRSREHSIEKIQNLIVGGNYDVIHYAGHGEFNDADPEASGLIFFKDNSASEKVTVTTGALQDLLFSSSVRLFFLNACSTAARGNDLQTLDRDFIGILDALVVAKIPTIVGLRWPIKDDSAPLLSQTFYDSLLQTGSPTNALWMARRALARRDRNDPAWASPILIMQEG